MKIVSILLLPVALICTGCDRHVYATRIMTWECTPATPVTFRYIDDPDYHDVSSGRGLCEQLRASGKKTAEVMYDVWGNAWQGMRGYRIESVDGQPLPDFGGPAWSGHEGIGNRPHPLERALK
jgi:hypothetical protein